MRPFSTIFNTMTDVIPSIKRRSLAPIVEIRTFFEAESIHSYVFKRTIYSTEFRPYRPFDFANNSSHHTGMRNVDSREYIQGLHGQFN